MKLEPYVMVKPVLGVLYRYNDVRVSDWDMWEEVSRNHRTELRLEEYNIIKKTPKGVWIEYKYYKKFVLLETNMKKFAHPTKEAAIKSFIRRKCRQLEIISAQEKRAKDAISLGRNMESKLAKEAADANESLLRERAAEEQSQEHPSEGGNVLHAELG